MPAPCIFGIYPERRVLHADVRRIGATSPTDPPGPARTVLAVATVGVLSFRLGGGDGVSIEAAKWMGALETLGHRVHTVAGSGGADVLVKGLGLPDAGGPPPDPPTRAEVEGALASCDVVVVENLCSLPLNPPAAEVVAKVLTGRPAVLHHHDLPWQRPHLAHFGPPPDDRGWRHVTINELSRRELADHGITATTLYNRFDCAPTVGERATIRRRLGVTDEQVLVLQPTRALVRKNIGAAIDLCERLGATYWLLGPAEDGYDDELARLVDAARCRLVLGMPDGEPVDIVDAYAACDVVALPSTWEGFGNPTVESAVHRRPLAVGRYRVAVELAGFGFNWFWFGEGSEAAAVPAEQLGTWLERRDPALLEHNVAVAEQHFNLRDLPTCLGEVLDGLI
jgi:glycosyltransferase involved in cell wall biosynthesis